MNPSLRNILVVIILTLALIGVSFLIGKKEAGEKLEISDQSVIEAPTEVEIKISETPKDQNILLNIPFTSQAPFGNWADARQEDGCEEASVLMVMHWVKETNLAPEEALAVIISISDYELARFGEFRETSLRDTGERILRGYFGYDNFEIRYGINAEDIKEELYKGNAVIVPINGQLLFNPFYTPPGPRDHMIVIQGYDNNTKEFITNDPGTRNGEKFRYAEDLLFEAIQDYPTGNHEFIDQVVKGMLVIRK